MGKISGEAAPAGVVKATKPSKKVKREPEDGDLETKTNLKKQKKDADADDRLQRLESKFDMLVTKLDLLIAATGNRDQVKKLVKAKAKAAISSSEDDESSSSDDKDSEEKPVECATSSDSSSDDEESDRGEKPEEKMAKADKKITKEDSVSVDDSSEKSDEKESEDRFGFAPGRFVGGPLGFRGRGRGRWPFGGPFVGGRCGGLGHCSGC